MAQTGDWYKFYVLAEDVPHLEWIERRLAEYLDGTEYVDALDAGPFLDWLGVRAPKFEEIDG